MKAVLNSNFHLQVQMKSKDNIIGILLLNGWDGEHFTFNSLIPYTYYTASQTLSMVFSRTKLPDHKLQTNVKLRAYKNTLMLLLIDGGGV